MGLTGALRDRARCIREVRTGERIEGQPQIRPVLSEWFKCRIEPANTSAKNDEGHWERKATTYVICSKYDIKRQPLTILATDYIRVVSADVDVGEDAVWQIDGDVVPMRRRQGILGFEFKINQVRESPTWLDASFAKTLFGL